MNYGGVFLDSLRIRMRFAIILLCGVIIGGRWITQIWLGPTPLFDLILQFLIGASSIYLIIRGNRLHGFVGIFRLIPYLSIFIFIVTVLRIILSFISGYYPAEAIFRDSSVFLSLSSVYFLSNYFYQFSQNSIESRLTRLIFLASAFALFLAFFSKFGSNFEGWNLQLPLFRFEANVLSVRSDQLVTSLSCFLISCSYKIATEQSKRNFWRFLYLASGAFVIIELSSRVVFLSFLIIYFLGLILKRRVLVDRDQKLVTFPIAIFGALILISSFSERIPGLKRLIAGFSSNSIDSNSDALQLSASGTQNARIQAWKLIWAYWSNHGFYNGVDFGDHFILNSGAFRYLSGATDVRWPHNFLISIFVRNGILIGPLIILLIALLLIITIENLRHESTTLLDWQLFSISLTILVVSSVGVVFESPLVTFLLSSPIQSL